MDGEVDTRAKSILYLLNSIFFFLLYMFGFGNSKYEYRNTKQIQILNVQITKTLFLNMYPVCGLF